MVNGLFPDFPSCPQRGVNAHWIRTARKGGGYRVQRKTFRIEQMVGRAGKEPAASSGGVSSEPAGEAQVQPDTRAAMTQELAAILAAIARNMRELSVLIKDGNGRRMTRAAGELGAAVEGMETATQKILASAEVIDDCARTLAAALDDEYHHGLAQDMQDHVVRMYEACNFQDLAGQRIGKVIAMLIMIEERLVAMMERNNASDEQRAPGSDGSPDTGLINGPRLDGAGGHASQLDIDAMFA